MVARDGGLRPHDEVPEDMEWLFEGDFSFNGRDSCREAGGHCLFGDGGGDGGGHGVGFPVTFRSFVVISLIFVVFVVIFLESSQKYLSSIETN